MGIKLGRVLQLVFTPAIAISTIFAAQANAAIFSRSQVSLILENFNQIPQDISSDQDVDAIAISDGALVTANIIFDSVFFADESQVFAISESLNESSGEGRRFFGKAEFESELTGVFNVSAGQDFSFDFEILLNLENTVDGSQSGSVSTRGGTFFTLIDNKLTNDPNDDVSLIENTETRLITGLNEFAGFFSKDSFRRTFSDDTQLELIVRTTNESCVQAPKVDDACVKVPESSNLLALILFGSLLGILSSVMKPVIQLAR